MRLKLHHISSHKWAAVGPDLGWLSASATLFRKVWASLTFFFFSSFLVLLINNPSSIKRRALVHQYWIPRENASIKCYIVQKNKKLDLSLSSTNPSQQNWLCSPSQKVNTLTCINMFGVVRFINKKIVYMCTLIIENYKISEKLKYEKTKKKKKEAQHTTGLLGWRKKEAEKFVLWTVVPFCSSPKQAVEVLCSRI